MIAESDSDAEMPELIQVTAEFLHALTSYDPVQSVYSSLSSTCFVSTPDPLPVVSASSEVSVFPPPGRFLVP